MNTYPMNTAKTTATAGLLLLTSLAAACGGDGAGDANRPDTVETRPAPTAQATSVTGCVKGGDATGSYVLVAQREPMGAAVDRATRGHVATYTYVLEGQGLAQHVGRQVVATGTIEEKDDLEVEETALDRRAHPMIDSQPCLYASRRIRRFASSELVNLVWAASQTRRL